MKWEGLPPWHNHGMVTEQKNHPEAPSQAGSYLISLVDAVDELLRRWIPEELDSGGVYSFCLHILWGRSGHCSKGSQKTAKQMAGGTVGRRDESESLSCHS